MKKCFALLCFMVYGICSTHAQDVARNQEFQMGIDIYTGIRSPTLYYKLNFKKKAENFWRLRFGVSSDEYYYDTIKTHLNYSKQSFGVGFEKRTPKTKRSQLVGGIEVIGNHQAYTDIFTLDDKNKHAEAWGLGIGVPLGVIFNKSSKWYVALEFMPTFYYQITTMDEHNLTNDNHSFNLDADGLSICFGYRIPTKRV